MTPKEKAKELVYKFDDTMEFSTPQRFAKLCALIAVNEIINELDDNFDSLHCSDIKEFWRKVKQEIKKL